MFCASTRQYPNGNADATSAPAVQPHVGFLDAAPTNNPSRLGLGRASLRDGSRQARRLRDMTEFAVQDGMVTGLRPLWNSYAAAAQSTSLPYPRR
jgi:hypothetical protein